MRRLTALLGSLALLLACAAAASAQSGVADCLREDPTRYAAPGTAVDDQYAGSEDACRALIEGGEDVQVTVTPDAGGGEPPAGADSASPGTAPERPATPALPGPDGTSAAGGASGGGGATAGGGTAGAPAGAGSAPPASASATVERAIAQAGSGAGGAGLPGGVSRAPAWLLALGGGLLAAIAGAAAFGVYRRRA